MKKLNIIILLLILALGESNSQTLKLTRTDVDSSRAGFVTAKYLFGVDIIAEDLTRASAVSFALKWTQNQYIKFSEWKIGYLGDSSTAFVYPYEDEASDEGYVSVGVTASEPEVSQGYDNPTVIHLEFAVSQAATNGEDVVFSFVSARANVNVDTGRYDITLNTEPVTYTIHSYMNVWPGDADNNGVVNEHDVLPIDQYFDYGSNVKDMKTFKRINPSTLWVAQRVLAWDEMNAAHADCDGNGVVNETDVLVIYANVNEIHNIIENKGSSPLSGPMQYKPCGSSTSVEIPIYAESLMPFVGISAGISWPGLPAGAEVLGFNKGELYDDAGTMFFCKLNEEKTMAKISTGNLNKQESEKGIVAYMVVEPNGTELGNFRPKVESMSGINSGSYIFPMYQPNSIDFEKETEKISCNYFNDMLHIQLAPEYHKADLIVYDLLGNIVLNRTIGNSEEHILLNNLNSGVYVALINTGREIENYRFTVVK